MSVLRGEPYLEMRAYVDNIDVACRRVEVSFQY